MKIHQGFLQGSEEWFALRRGRVTASQFSRIITPAKGEYSKQAASYMRDLVVECFCPDYAKFVGNKWTDRGTEMEPEARKAFEAHTGLVTEQVAFVTADRWKHVVGCSPDSLLKDAAGNYVAGLEIKCPSPFTHAEYIEAGVLPDEYKAQVHGSMAVTGLNKWHFWSYFPNLAPFHLVVERDAYTEKLTAALDQFVIDYGAYRQRMTPKLQTTHNHTLPCNPSRLNNSSTNLPTSAKSSASTQKSKPGTSTKPCSHLKHAASAACRLDGIGPPTNPTQPFDFLTHEIDP